MKKRLLLVASAAVAVAMLDAPAQDMVPTPGPTPPQSGTPVPTPGWTPAPTRTPEAAPPLRRGMPRTPNSLDPEKTPAPEPERPPAPGVMPTVVATPTQATRSRSERGE